MVRVDDEKFKNLSRDKKIAKLDSLKAKADEKIADIQFKVDLINNYKDKLDSEKSKI